MPASVPPPIISAAAPVRTVSVLTFEPGTVICAGVVVAGGAVERPISVLATRYGAAQMRAPFPLYRLTFAIDANGRPHTIRSEGLRQFSEISVDTSDLAPSLAVSHFAAGAARTDCSISYVVNAVPVDAVPLPALYEIASRPQPQYAIEEVMERVRPADADCARGPGPYLRLNQPAFETIPQRPGTQSWTFLGYDVDAAGKPVKVRVLGSAGNAVLDRAALRALTDNRYARGPGYRGCTYHFYRVGPPTRMAAELPADLPADTGELAACRIDPKLVRGLLGGSSYPPAESRRRLEGYAVIRFDTAPWGAIGNVSVVASEPDDSFGETGRGALQSAQTAENDVGHRGCVRRIRFRLPAERLPG